MESPDIIIVGSGAGGGTLARVLSGSGARVLLIERGPWLPVEAENRSPQAVFQQNRYKAHESWYDQRGRPFKPGVHYWVGGNTKVYGAALPRLRQQDFEAIEHEGGTSPAWPIRYEDLAPYYDIAESMYWVHGIRGADPFDPPRSGDYPYPPMPAGQYMDELAERFRAQNLHPFPLPIGVDYRTGGRCVYCQTCDAFPCPDKAKADAETCGVTPALLDLNITLRTDTLVKRVLTDSAGAVAIGVEVERNGEVEVIKAGIVIVAAGAVNSAALLLRSANGAHPKGLANSSGQVGRNYMMHNNSVLIAIDPSRPNPTVFQKSWSLNDFYFSGPGFPWPVGNLQPIGKLNPPMIAGALPKVPQALLEPMLARSVDYWVMSEDLPDPDNRVTLDNGKIVVAWRPNNLTAHRRLQQTARSVFREAGYKMVFTREMGIETNSHQVGTVRFGNDPQHAPLDPWCRAWDVPNLYVVDASFFPSSAAMNPALTIIAQAIRVGEKIRGLPIQ